jgi:hypothetical protein
MKIRKNKQNQKTNRREMTVDINNSDTFKKAQEMNDKALKILAKRM